MTHHTCPYITRHGFEVYQNSLTHEWVLFDKLAHMYLYFIKHCPFCGKEL